MIPRQGDPEKKTHSPTFISCRFSKFVLFIIYEIDSFCNVPVDFYEVDKIKAWSPDKMILTNWASWQAVS